MVIAIIVILILVAVVVVFGLGFVYTKTRKMAKLAKDLPSLLEEGKLDTLTKLDRGDYGQTTVKTKPEELIVPQIDLQKVTEKPATLKDRLVVSRSVFSNYLPKLSKANTISAEVYSDLEEALLLADVGLKTTTSILQNLKTKIKEKEVTDSELLLELLKGEIVSCLKVGNSELSFPEVKSETDKTKPVVYLFVGVNGVGKTTTIGKLASQYIKEGKKVMLAAGDTFRAAAREQLNLWAERTGADIVSGQDGADPASVIFDAVNSAYSKGFDIVLADTAGRLQNKVNLMAEIKKVKKVASKDPGELAEVLLVVDATTGQNGVTQAKVFKEATDLTGIVLTKLDGSAKGGVAISIGQTLGVPVKMIGVGEKVEDLMKFNAEEFVDALLDL